MYIKHAEKLFQRNTYRSDELEKMQESYKHQLIFALLTYLEKVGDPFLIIGSHIRLHELLKISKDYTNYEYPNLEVN